MNNWISSKNPLIIGHRGASADAPENTLKAFQLAREQGAAGIEFDVQLTRDGVPIIIHDATLDRTTNATGRVAETHSHDLVGVDAGEGELIPHLADLFASMDHDFLYNIEIKETGDRAQTAVQTIANLIEYFNLQSQVLVSSFNYAVLRHAQTIMPPTVALAAIRDADSPPYPSFFSGHADHPHWPLVDPTYLQWAEKQNHRVHVWTVDDPALGKQLLIAGVHALITNNPKAFAPLRLL